MDISPESPLFQVCQFCEKVFTQSMSSDNQLGNKTQLPTKIPQTTHTSATSVTADARRVNGKVVRSHALLAEQLKRNALLVNRVCDVKKRMCVACTSRRVEI